MSRFVCAAALAVLSFGLVGCRSGHYAGLSAKEARQQADIAIKTKGPKVSEYTSFIALRFRRIEKGRFPLGPKAWIVSYSGTDTQSRHGAAMCVWLRKSDGQVTSGVGLC
jgi:hypothetical protein